MLTILHSLPKGGREAWLKYAVADFHFVFIGLIVTILGLLQGLDVLSIRSGDLLLLCNIFFLRCFLGLHLSRLWKLAWGGDWSGLALLLYDLLYLHLLNQ